MGLSLTWESVAHHSHLYVLPTAGAAALVVGSLTLLGVHSDFARYLPVALTLLGAVALLGSLASYMCHPGSIIRGVPDTPRSHLTSPAREGTSAGGGLPGTARQRTPESHGSAGIARAVVAKATRLWDDPWQQWSTPRSAPLGAQLVGPVPETAYSPPRAGASALFPNRDQDLLFLHKDGTLSGNDRPVTRSRTNVPAPPSRAIPTAAPRSARATVERPFESPGSAGSLLSGHAGILPALDSLDHLAFVDSVDPILPRLDSRHRASAPTRSGEGIHAPPRGKVRRFCSDCSQRLEDFQTWVECRTCRRPVCRRCLHHSFSRGDEGSCSDCGDRQNWSVG